MNARRTSIAFRRSLLLGSALAALAAAPEAARAQAFDGTPTVAAGDAIFSFPEPGKEIITIRSPSAVINWTRREGAGDPWIFLPSGHEATFQGAQDFAVLNRLLPSASERVIMDGTVLGRLAGANTPTTNGIIAFYTPNGLIIGGNALFDVGSLILTTLDPLFNTDGTFVDSSRFYNFRLGDTPDASRSFILTDPGARINALQDGSFVIFAAPAIIHDGSVRVNGSAAYVAMREGSVRVNEGLFDILVTIGTAQTDGIIHTGSTGGPASTGAADPHRIYMVAAAQGAATQLLMGGSVGFDEATSASIENGVIYLSSGPVTPQINDFVQSPGVPIDNGSAAGNIIFDELDIRSRMQGFATRSITMDASAFNSREIANVNLFAGNNIVMTASTGNIFAGTLGADDLIDLDATRGNVRIGTGIAGQTFTIDAAGAIAFTGATGRAVTLTAGTTITGGTVRTPNATSGFPDTIILKAPGAVAIDSATSSENITIEAGSLTANGLASTGDTVVTSPGAVTVGTSTSGQDMTITGATTRVTTANAGRNMALTATGGNLDAQTLTSGGTMTLAASQNLSFANATAATPSGNAQELSSTS